MLPLVPPAPLPLIEDARPFEAAARDGLTAFPGCHAIQGVVEQELGLGVFGREREAYVFTARLQDGAWVGLAATSTLDEQPGSSVRFSDGSAAVPFVPPLLGRMPDAETGEGSLAAELMRLLETEVETVMVVPTEDHARYRLVRVLDSRRGLLGPGRENRAEVLIDPGSLRARSWRVTTEIAAHAGEGVRLRDVDIALELGDDGLPVRESLDAVGAWGPFALHIHRTIAYMVTGACAG